MEQAPWWSDDNPVGITTVQYMRRLLVGSAIFILCATPFTTAASAHDDATSSTPAAGAVVTSPSEVTLTFSEAVNPELVSGVLKSSGAESVKLASGRSGGGTTVVFSVPGTLPDGLWTFTWAATSRDSHQVAGAFAFTVKSGAPVVAANTTPPSKPVEKKPVSPYVLLGLSVALLVGLALGVSAARPRRG